MSAADTYIVSDVHLGNQHCHRDNFVRFLDQLPPGARLVLNGDIVDEPEDPLAPADEAILRRLLAESRRRQVVWVHGNHDDGYTLDDAGQIEFVERWAVEDLLLVLHGDELDGVMPRHSLFRKAFKGLHRLRVKLGFPDVHVADYAKKWGFLYRVLTRHVADRALRTAAAEGFRAVTCGHTHAPADLCVDGRRYLNTGSWTETPHHVVVVRGTAIDFREATALSRVAPDGTGASEAAPVRAASQEAAASEITPCRGAPDGARPDRAVPDEAALSDATPDRAAPDRRASTPPAS